MNNHCFYVEVTHLFKVNGFYVEIDAGLKILPTSVARCYSLAVVRMRASNKVTVDLECL